MNLYVQFEVVGHRMFGFILVINCKYIFRYLVHLVGCTGVCQFVNDIYLFSFIFPQSSMNFFKF